MHRFLRSTSYFTHPKQAATIVHGGEDGFANYINGISTKTKIACERRITALNTGVRHITRYMTTPTHARLTLDLRAEGVSLRFICPHFHRTIMPH